MKTRSHHHQTHPPTRQPPPLSHEKELIALASPKKLLKTQTCTSHLSAYDSIPLIPEHHLTIAEMQASPLPLLSRLQKEYGRFGAVKLVCPAEWSPPMQFKRPKLPLTTRLQPLHLLTLGKNRLYYRLLFTQSFEEKKQAHSLGAFHDLAVDLERKITLKISVQEGERRRELQEEYWRLVRGEEEGRQRVTVEYAADLPVNRYGSGFPVTSCNRSRDQHFDYALNGFNLNNTFRAEGSLLAMSAPRGEVIGGISTPWLYVGMLFSSFCWHVEDSGINSLNYHHSGGSKLWYVVPEESKEAFDAFVEKHHGDRQVVSRITFMIDPLELVKKGIKVYKTVQQSRQFVCTFFNAYHCGFSLGFNIGQAVNFLLPESLPYITRSLKVKAKPSVFCYEWLVYENYVRGMELGSVPEEIFEEYRRLLGEEQKGLKKIWNIVKSKHVRYVQSKVRYTRHLCATCKKYLYLSFTGCSKCRKEYCLSHSEICCQKGHLLLSLRDPNKDRKVYLSKLLSEV